MPSEDRLALLTRIVEQGKLVTTNGHELSKWLRALLQWGFAVVPFYGCGGVVVPQTGSDAGRSQPFFLASSVPPCLAEIELPPLDELLMLSQAPVRWRTGIPCTHGQPHLLALSRPINVEPGCALGFLWAITDIENETAVLHALESVASLSALAISDSKAREAIRHLAEPVWISESTTQQTALAAAIACREALACSAVLVWELDERKSPATLRMLAAAGCDDHPLEMRKGRGLAGRCALDNRLVIVTDLLDNSAVESIAPGGVEHPTVVAQQGWRSAIFVPLDIGGTTAGVMGAYGPRPRGFSTLDANIAASFAQRLTAGYVHLRRLNELTEMERRITLEAPAIEAGMLAMERVHDIDNKLILAQGKLSEITSRYRHDPQSWVNKAALAAGAYVYEAGQLVKALVDRSKLSKISPVGIPLARILEQAIDGRIQHRAKTIGAQLFVEPGDDLIVRADKLQLNRVFINLIDNALYFLETDTKPGRRMIKISAEQASPQSVRVSVWDNGPGIYEPNLKRVFDYLFTTRWTRGMGFGLAIARNIMLAHGGSISVESQWGEWTRFIITLPTTVRS